VGYGLEGRLTDGKTGRILDEHLEYLADDEFDAGMNEIFDDLVDEVNAEYLIEEDETGNFIEPTKEEAKIILAKRAERRKKTIKIVLWAAGIVLAAIIGLAFVVIRKINQRRAEERAILER